MKMKTLKIFITLFAIMAFVDVSAQKATKEELSIKVSSQCSICKETIEKALAFEKGVVNATLDLETDIVKVVYKSSKTTPEKIKKAISDVGYDADDVPANKEAYNNLPDCCKKPEDQQHDHSGHKH